MDAEGLLLFVAILCGILGSLEGKHRGKGCPIGCNSCSTYNGCLTCKPRYYFLLHRSGLKQVGLCTHACPSGFYPNSAGDYHRCSRCRIDNCETCHSLNFCSRCQAPYVGLYGKCVLQCPEPMYADERTGQCEVKVDCEVAPWSPWSSCSKQSKTCGHKWGEHARYRQIVKHPTPEGEACPGLIESERCRMPSRYCPGQADKRQRDRKRKRKERKDNLETVEGDVPRRNHGDHSERKRDRTNRRNRKDRPRATSKERRRERRRKGSSISEIPFGTEERTRI